MNGLPVDFKAGLLPGNHAARKVPDVGIPQAHQGLGSDSAHPPTAALQHNPGALIRQPVKVLANLVIRDGQIRPADIALKRNVNVYQGEILIR